MHPDPFNWQHRFLNERNRQCEAQTKFIDSQVAAAKRADTLKAPSLPEIPIIREPLLRPGAAFKPAPKPSLGKRFMRWLYG